MFTSFMDGRAAAIALRRLAPRQGEHKACAPNLTAFEAIFARDAAAMRLHDGAAYRQPQADAGDSGFFAAAFKFLKHRLFAPQGQTRAIVV
jgi:hypothetical protein